MNPKRPSSLPLASKLFAVKRVHTSDHSEVDFRSAPHTTHPNNKPSFQLVKTESPNHFSLVRQNEATTSYPASPLEGKGPIWSPLSASEIGYRKPVWAPDTEVTLCMLCQSPFVGAQCRYHCRACGRLVCPVCCKHRIRLPFASIVNVSCRTRKLDHITNGSRKGLSSGRRITSPLVYSRPSQLMSDTRLARVCVNCFIILSNRTANATAMSVDSQSPSPQNGKLSLLPVGQEQTNCAFDLSLPVDAELGRTASHMRTEQLLCPAPVPGQRSCEGMTCQDVCKRCWPPLVTRVDGVPSFQWTHDPELLASLLRRPTSHSTSPSSPLSSLPFDHSVIPGSGAELSTGSPLQLAITKNLLVQVHATQLTCCLNQPAWCFSSLGLPTVIPGQQEIVLVLLQQQQPRCELSPGQGRRLPPVWVFHLYRLIYLALLDLHRPGTEAQRTQSRGRSNRHAAQRGKTSFNALDCFIPADWFRAETLGAGDVQLPSCLFFSPTHQCLKGLRLPQAPFLLTALLHPSEELCARHMPLRLLLRLGRASRYYPTPVYCDQRRGELYSSGEGLAGLGTLGDRLLALDVNNKDKAVVLLHSRGTRIRIRSSDSQNGAQGVEILIPPDSSSRVKGQLAGRQCPMELILLASFDAEADSHLVCLQVDEGQQQLADGRSPTKESRLLVTEAISIADVRRRLTGVTFAVISANSSSDDSEQTVTLRLVEDGIALQLHRTEFTRLLAALLKGEDLVCPAAAPSTTGSLACLKRSANAVVSLSLHWQSVDELQPELDADRWQTSWVDTERISAQSTYSVPLGYQLVPWLKTKLPGAGREEDLPLAWLRLHVLSAPKGLPLGRMACALACSLNKGLLPHLGDLLARGHTQIGLRVHLELPDQSGYQLSAVSPFGQGQLTSSRSSLGDWVTEGLSDSVDRVLTPDLVMCLQILRRCSTSVEGPHGMTSVVMEMDFCLLLLLDRCH